jgi:hypothetical protein
VQKIGVSPFNSEGHVMLEVRFSVPGQTGEQQRRDENSSHQVISLSIPPQIAMACIVQDVSKRPLAVGDQHNCQRRQQLTPPHNQCHSAEDADPVERYVQHRTHGAQPEQGAVRVTLSAQARSKLGHVRKNI